MAFLESLNSISAISVTNLYLLWAFQCSFRSSPVWHFLPSFTSTFAKIINHLMFYPWKDFRLVVSWWSFSHSCWWYFQLRCNLVHEFCAFFYPCQLILLEHLTSARFKHLFLQSYLSFLVLICYLDQHLFHWHQIFLGLPCHFQRHIFVLG